jgi:hypothetical protein
VFYLFCLIHISNENEATRCIMAEEQFCRPSVRGKLNGASGGATFAPTRRIGLQRIVNDF